MLFYVIAYDIFYPLSSHTFSQVEIWGGLPLTEPPNSIII